MISPNPDFAPLDVVRLLRQAGLPARRSLGQNFLVDEQMLARIVDCADLGPKDVVLEIGAGLGSLTRHLASHAGQVIAVEIDSALLSVLRGVAGPWKNVLLVEGDILGLDPEALTAPFAAGSYLVVANLPYYITSAVIRHLLEAPHRPQRMILTVQEEVAGRICATPGSMSLLSLSVQYFGRPQIAFRIPAQCFFPVPKVDSAVVRVDLDPARGLEPLGNRAFFRVARAGFSQRRKQLHNALGAGLAVDDRRVRDWMSRVAVDPARRAETLSIAEWKCLADALPELLADSRQESPSD
ncbi:MAG: 16S rRNA (adenine(1518)-N(6)/adenine(1519)-N(6))-dimethyltransferase RsmA [Anaerolineales bacterium]|jgi:16S rRNA (adenine1518-N6/adenine1519-N6)-dimethyltransferase